jgi:hypothetical protein
VNQFLDPRYTEHVDRLALGIEPIDAKRLHRVARRLQITVERPPKATAKPAVVRHSSCRHVLLYYPALVDQVDIRIFEDSRWFVSRRFTVPLHPLATVDTFPASDRVRRPFLYPGAAYELDSCATGIRGRVLRGGNPMRWARVEATLPSTGKVVARAHGDDRGEFLLVIGPDAIPVGELVDPLALNVTVFGPNPIPVPATPDLPSIDPLWDLPLETPPAPGTKDTVSTGETLPVNYTAASAAVSVDFTLGELRSGLAAFTIT